VTDRNSTDPRRLSFWIVTGFLFTLCGIPVRSHAAGVTLITHGFNSDVNGWVTAMADAIPEHDLFPGTNFTTYKITVTHGGSSYFFTTTRTNGSAPSASDSGEIIVKFDWSQLADDLFDSYASTYPVALATSQALMQTNLISELGGHALVELPLHLVGHSRGGSLVSELARQLGTNGIWVDHLTTLDPYPINNDGNSDLVPIVDAPARNTYINVLFADNYWQNLGAGFLFGDPDGEAVSGAYVRQLHNLSGGYTSDHSNVHLWYHGTVDTNTPASYSDGGTITINPTMRTNWWTAYEDQGVVAGFYYSLIGGGDRLSTDQPLGPGFPALRDGYNQIWDLGAGVSANRTALTANNGNWPNLIRFDRMDTNALVQGQSAPLQFYYQWARANTNVATVSIYLDDDLNPFNNNQTLLTTFGVTGTGATNVNHAAVATTLSAASASPGWHSLLAVINGGGRTRYLYAPEWIQVLSALQPPALDVVLLSPSQIQVGVNGLVTQTIILQSSLDLVSWQSFATNTLATNRWVYIDNTFAGTPQKFYRAMIAR
jgi:hypothetical protein